MGRLWVYSKEIYQECTNFRCQKEKYLQPLTLTYALQIADDGIGKYLRIYLRGLDGGMPQHLLHRRDGDALVNQQGRTGVPARMEQNPQSSRRQTSKDKT